MIFFGEVINVEAMTKTLGAVFDGKTFCPDEPVDLQPNTHVTITVEISVNGSANKGDGEDPLEKLFGSVSLGHPLGLDNEKIDEDLSLEYASNHENEN
jgi:hypothetical protein